VPRAQPGSRTGWLGRKEQMFGGRQQNARRGRSDQRASAPRSPPPPRSADRGRVSSLPRWRGPVSRTLCPSDGEKELPPMPRSRIEIYWKTPETAPDGVIAQVRVTDYSGSDYLLPYPCELTEDGWVNAASGKPLAVRVTYWKPYVETLPRTKPGRGIIRSGATKVRTSRLAAGKKGGG
jgi:hypothetical protein